jgi:hypothetical protein
MSNPDSNWAGVAVGAGIAQRMGLGTLDSLKVWREAYLLPF